MPAKSKYRGHDIEFNGKYWIFSDNKSLVEYNKDRKCGNCNKPNTDKGHDACLGELPGVMNACCGHGDESGAYIQFLDGKIIRGEKATKIISEMKTSKIE